MIEFANTAEEYVYPEIGAEESRFRNLLATRSLKLGITTITGNLEINLSPENRLAERTIHAEGTVAGTQFSLSCDQGFLSILLGNWFSFADFSELPKELRLGVFEATVQPALDTFFTKTGESIEFSDLSLGETPVGSGLRMGFSTENEGLGGEIVFAEKALPKLLNWCGFLAPHPSTDIPDVPVPIRIRVAGAQLSADELQSLETGDIIFLDWHGFESGCFELTMGGETAFEAFVEKNRLVLGKQLGENNDTQTNGKDAVAPAELLFRLHLELPEKTFYAKALSQLQPGRVITGAPATSENLLVRVGSTVIAKCELVTISGQSAARLFAINEGLPMLFASQEEDRNESQGKEQAETQAVSTPS